MPPTMFWLTGARTQRAWWVVSKTWEIVLPSVNFLSSVRTNAKTQKPLPQAPFPHFVVVAENSCSEKTCEIWAGVILDCSGYQKDIGKKDY